VDEGFKAMNFSMPQLKISTRFSSREKKILTLGGAAAILFGGLYFFILPAYDAAKQYPEQIADKTKRLQKYKEVIGRRPAQEQSLVHTRTRLTELESHLLAARTLAAAQAELQGLVNDMAKQTQLQVSRSDFLPKKELSKDYEKVSVRLDAMGPINQITAFLLAAKASRAFVLNDDLRIWNYSGMSEDFKKTKRIAATIVVSGVIRHE
jgi:hypothetical protein